MIRSGANPFQHTGTKQTIAPFGLGIVGADGLYHGICANLRQRPLAFRKKQIASSSRQLS